jgi:hypothetical protein
LWELSMMHSSGHKADSDGIVTDTPETACASYMGQSKAHVS